MRIAVFIKKTTFHKNYGGLEMQNRILCEGLASRGHEVTVFSPKLSLEKDSCEQAGVFYKFIECEYRSFAGFDRLFKNSWINKSVEKFGIAHKKVQFDVVLGQSSAVLGIIRKKDELGVKVISISHGTIVGEYKTRLQTTKSVKDMLMLIPDTAYLLLNFFGRQREFVLHSNKVIVVSNTVKKAIVDETFIPENKLAVIYNGIDPRDIEKTKRVDNGVVKILYVGRVHLSKGLKDLAEAVSSDEFESVELHVVGAGEHLGKIREIVDKAGLRSRVFFHGELKHSDVLEMMSKSDIFVLPSRRVEGFPMTLVEAMLCGMPIVGSDMGGIPEAVEDEKTGFIFESGNVTKLREKIGTLVENGALRMKMGSKGRKRAMDKFTVDAMLDKYEKVIKEVVG